MPTTSIRTRFAPSPTGLPHIGSLWQGLMQYFFARHEGGALILRIEDTDRARYNADAEAAILEAMAWIGVTFDEGPHIGGAYGPYRQSERLDIYRTHAAELVGKGHAYYCFCTAERLQTLREEQAAAKMPTGYDGRCRELRMDDCERRLKDGEPHVIRMRMPREGETTFTDSIRGVIAFQNRMIDDQVLVKSDGWPTYHLAAVVDDHLMEISHVIRGEEWLSSTPKHLALYEMFGWQPPVFAHLPLILGPDRSKLSKRHGSAEALAYQRGGYLSEAMVNFLALLGWNPKTNDEMFSMDDIVRLFTFDHMNKAGAVFNIDKLKWFNAHYIKTLSLDELVSRSLPFLEAGHVLTARGDSWLGSDGRMFSRQQLGAIIRAVRERVVVLTDFVPLSASMLGPITYDAALLNWKGTSQDVTRDRLRHIASTLELISSDTFSESTIEATLKNMITTNGFSTGETLWPMRVALSGSKESIGPFALAGCLGKDETLRRIEHAVSL